MHLLLLSERMHARVSMMHSLAVAFSQGNSDTVHFQQGLHDAVHLLNIHILWCAGKYIRLYSPESQRHHLCKDHPVR